MKDYLSLDFSQGMVLVGQRLDLPSNIPRILENFDLSIPGRPRLLAQDALIGKNGEIEPTPNHNTLASSSLGWTWPVHTDGLLNYWTLGVFGDDLVLGRITGTKGYLKGIAKGGSSWIDLSGDAFDETLEPFGMKRNIYIPTTGEHRIAWEPSSTSYSKCGGMWKIASDMVLDSGGIDIIYRQNEVDMSQYDPDAAGGVGTDDPATVYECWLCLKDITKIPAIDTTEAVDPKAIPTASAIMEDPTHPSLEYWAFLGHILEGAPEAALFGSNFDGKPIVVGDMVTVSNAGTPVKGIKASYTITPFAALALPAEVTSGVVNDLGLTVDYASAATAATGARPYSGFEHSPDVSDGFTTVADHPDYPVGTDSLADTAETGTIESGVIAPDFIIKSLSWSEPDSSDWRKKWQNNSVASAAEIQWKGARSYQYYVIAEYGHGGFSDPKLIGDVGINVNDESKNAVGIQVWHNPSAWGRAIVRYHVFRCEVAGADNQILDEVWLFAVDRASSHWIGDDKEHAMLAPVAMNLPPDSNFFTVGASCWLDARNDGYNGLAAAISSVPEGVPGMPWMSSVYTSYPFTRIWNATQGAALLANAIYSLCMGSVHRHLNREYGIDICQGVKPGVGLFSFVDYGQDIIGEDAEGLTGCSIRDYLEREFDESDLTPIGSAFGRMFYKFDTTNKTVIYYSEIDRPTIIRLSNYIPFGDTGEPIGVTAVHSFAVFFFSRRTIILDMRSGLDTGWSTVADLKGVGCYSRRSIAHYGDMIVWAGSGTVWSWNGEGEPEDIGKAIQYEGIDDDFQLGKAQMWGIIDPIRKDYLLYMPYNASYSGYGQMLFNAENAPSQVASALVYQFGTRAWSKETFRPFISATSTTETGQLSASKTAFLLDNHLLVALGGDHAAATEAPYLAVRQSYDPLTSTHTASCPVWKLQTFETGLLDMGKGFVAKGLHRFHVAFSGKDDRGQSPAVTSANWNHWIAYLWAYDQQAWGGASVLPAPYTSPTSADWTKSFLTINDEVEEDPVGNDAYDSSFYQVLIDGLRGQHFILRMVGGHWFGQGTAGWWECALAEIGELGISFSWENQP